jgi:hypothetical protein
VHGPVGPNARAVNLGSFEHGLADGKAGTRFAQVGPPEYERGYNEGRACASAKQPPPPPPGYEHTVVDQTPCARCGHFKGDHWGRCRVSKPTGAAGEAAWAMCECDAFVDAAGTVHPDHGVVDFGRVPNLEAPSPDPIGGGSS